jgi:hypothetical protein
VRLGEREHVRVDARAEVLERDAQRPQPAVAADHRRRRREEQPLRPLNGCGRKRDAQSIAFLSTPGTEALYSGEAITKASAASRRSRSASAPAGIPAPFSTSWSYDGQSKSLIAARSTTPPRSSITVAASAARRSLSEPRRSDAPKTRRRTTRRSARDGSEGMALGIAVVERAPRRRRAPPGGAHGRCHRRRRGQRRAARRDCLA